LNSSATFHYYTTYSNDRKVSQIIFVDIQVSTDERNKKMKAIQYAEQGSYEYLKQVELPKPIPKHHEVLVRITAASVTPSDSKLLLGRLPFPIQLPRIPGNAGAGVIEVPGDSGLPVGTRVVLAGFYGFEDDGTWREYMAVPAYQVVPLPDHVTDVEAGGFIEAYLTAYVALIYSGGFQSGQKVLIPGVGGGVGNAAVQLAQALGASQVITTAGSTAKTERARAAGYTHTLDLSQERLSDGVERLTNGEGVPLVIDSLGGVIGEQALHVLAPGGTMVAVGTSAGREVKLDYLQLMMKHTRLVGSSPGEFPHEMLQKAIQSMLLLLEAGKIHPLVSRTFPLEQAADALRYMDENRPFGRVMLTLV
jgi:NADPH:quinone reductase